MSYRLLVLGAHSYHLNFAWHISLLRAINHAISRGMRFQLVMLEEKPSFCDPREPRERVSTAFSTQADDLETNI